MNSMSVDVRKLLCDAGIGTDAAIEPDSEWAVYVSQTPHEPGRAISLHDTGGEKPRLYLRQVPPTEYPTLQVKVRGYTYVEAEAKAWEVYNALNQCGRFTAERPEQEDDLSITDASGLPYTYADIQALQTPYFLEYDANRRAVFVMNFRAIRQRETTTI